MIRGIVQYEVHVLDEGRWTLVGRYPGAQREEAVKEAGHLEFQTGRPTKVVRDTYFPETNQNEEVTTYISPKGRALQAMISRRKAMTAVARRDVDMTGKPLRRAAAPQRVVRPRRPARAEMTVRIIVAVGASVLFATIVTAVISSVFAQVAKIVPAIPSDASNMVMAVTYLLSFLYTFPRAFRARLRLHQIILELWSNTSKPSIKAAPLPEKARPRRAKERPWDTMRFDTKPPPPPVLEVPPPPPTLEPVIHHIAVQPAAPSPPPPPPVPPVTAPIVEPVQTKREEEKKPAAEKPTPEPTAPSFAAAVPTAADKSGLKLERIVLRRFAVDVVLPAVAKAHRDDPVTRRGIALILVGAIRELGETTKITDGAATSLLTEALLQTGSKQASIDSFLASYHSHLAAPNVTPLLAAGKAAIKRYAEGGANIGPALLDALAAWRFPSMARPVPMRTSYYLLSESQGLAEDGIESSADVALHDTTARMAVLERGGEIVPHEGAGILARFSDEDTARTAADAIRASIATIAGPSALVAVIERSQAEAEPEDIAAAHEQARISLRVSQETGIGEELTPFDSSTPTAEVTASQDAPASANISAPATP